MTYRISNQGITSYDIESLLQEWDGNLSTTRRDYICRCPFCGKEKKLWVQKENKIFQCWVCKEKGHIYRLVGVLKGISWDEAYKLVHKVDPQCTKYDEVLNFVLKNDLSQKEENSHLPNLELPARMKFTLDLPDSHEAREYLEYRGIDENKIHYFDIHYDEIDNRIIFPVYLYDKLVGWQGRDITGMAQPKIKSSPDFPKAKVLYNYNQIFYSMPEYAMLVEGPIDAIKAQDFNAIGLFGKFLNTEQLNLLLKIPTLKKMYIALDPEEQEQRNHLMKELSAFWETFWVPIEDGKDIGMYGYYEIEALVKRAVSIYSVQEVLKI